MIQTFDNEWKQKVSENHPEGSWVSALATERNFSKVYLNNLRKWLIELPATENIKRDFTKRLESAENSTHWGALNEIIWWRILHSRNCESIFVPTAAGSRPDLEVQSPVQYFAEITTLNQSKEDSEAWKNGCGVELNNKKAIYRLLGKLTDEKMGQLQYATDRDFPAVLVIFNASTFSNFGTDFKLALADYLYRDAGNAAGLPSQLSAIVYVEKQFNNGNFQISICRCGVFHNPNAKYSLSLDALNLFEQYQRSTVPLKSLSSNPMLRI